MDGGQFAAYRYSGYSNAGKIEEAKEKLTKWIEEKDLKTKGEMLSAGYDPPYTPADRRRNEVMIRVAK